MFSITLVVTMLATAAAPSSLPSGQARKVYSDCLSKLIKAKVPERLSGDAFTAAAKSGCAAQESAFRNALIAYDLASHVKRADAEEGAAAQIDDYMANAADTYSSYTTPN